MVELVGRRTECETLDRLVADLLDGAQQVGLGWDVIAAILGIPAIQAQERHTVLRARPDPQ